MGDVGETFKDWKEHKKEHGVPCPDCTVNLPKASPKILQPSQKCWCGYRDPRDRQTGR